MAVLLSFISEVYAQQQYFRVQPRDVKVHEGGEAMLECEVANLAGQVQWTKDGFALGKIYVRNFTKTAGEKKHDICQIKKKEIVEILGKDVFK